MIRLVLLSLPRDLRARRLLALPLLQALVLLGLNLPASGSHFRFWPGTGHRPVWSGTHKDLPCSASLEVGLKVCATIACPALFGFFN